MVYSERPIDGNQIIFPRLRGQGFGVKASGSGLGYCDLGSSIKKLAISIKTKMGR